MRLIDADNLILEINKLLESPYANHTELYTGMQVRKEAIETVRDLCVKQEPTAFDIEKVVEKFDERIDSLDSKNKICMDAGYLQSADRLAYRMCEAIKCKDIFKNAVTPVAVQKGETE